MDLDEYQRGALRTAAPRDKKNELLHLVLGLVGESGEIAEKFKKWVRDLDSDESRIDRPAVAKELGDVLWYVAVLADYLDLSLDDVATANLAKLASRSQRACWAAAATTADPQRLNPDHPTRSAPRNPPDCRDHRSA